MTKAKSLMNNIASALSEANLVRKTLDENHKILSDEAQSQFNEKEGDRFKALDKYTDFGYRYMNNTLRGLKNRSKYYNTPDTHEKINHLKTITRNQTKHNFIGYRGVAKSVYKDLNEGDIIHDKGFTSASIHPTIANMFHKDSDEGQRFKIHIKKGTKGYYGSGHGHTINESEHEFILHPGTKFKVGKTETDLKGNKWTNLHVHSQED